MALDTRDQGEALGVALPLPALDFRVVYDAHVRSVRRFLGDLLRDDTAADEATQETFVRAHSRLSTLREGDKVLPWLFGIARNVFYEELRARKRHLRSIDDNERDEEPDRSPSPEGMLLGVEADEQLSAALAALGEERRQALVMRIDHGLDYEEIAEVMGWPLSKVKNEIHRARLVLRTRLSKYVGGQ
ncbi:MAG: polymerase sigma-70 factor, subfamily [Myxococcales bacterium]|nr:polymerase sigma-70 factor, subfamily [Myxococcales bacterium]